MPGPPREMEFMWRREVAPRLQKLTEGTIITSKTLKVFGLSEAKVDELVGHILASKNPTVGTYAKRDGIYLRITAKAATMNKVQKLISQIEAEIRTILGDNIWGIDNDSLEKVVGDLLTEKHLTLATMESCTGGLLANVITNIPGASRYFKGSLITYADTSMSTFGINEHILSQNNAVSLELAKAMATTARVKLGASIGVGMTGITGPQEIDGMPVGTIFIGIDNNQHLHGFSKNYPGGRLQVKQRAVSSALFELRKILLQEETCT